MNPIVCLTQRVIVGPEFGERRDALDQRWIVFLEACGFTAAPLPNHARSAAALAQALRPAALLFTGGGDIGACGGADADRDATESALFEWSRQETLPVLGICRGAQHLTMLLGGRLARVQGHVGTRHALLRDGRRVNSYHSWGIAAAPPGAETTAIAEDGSIEAYSIAEQRIAAMLWHPERETEPHADDVAFFRSFILGEAG